MNKFFLKIIFLLCQTSIIYVSFISNLTMEISILTLIFLVTNYYMYIFLEDKKISIINVYQIGPIVTFLYTIIYPIFSLEKILNKNIFPIDEYILFETIQQSIKSFYIFSFLTILFYNSNKIYCNIKEGFEKKKLNYFKLNYFTLNITICVISIIKLIDNYVTYKSGFDRVNNLNTDNVGLNLLFQGVLLYSFYVAIIEKKYEKKIALLPIINFFLILCSNILLGNRRELILIILFICINITYFFQAGKLKTKQVIVLAILFFSFLCISVIRDENRSEENIIERKLFNLVGEFILPNFPLYKSIENIEKKNEVYLKFGKSYIQWPLYIIPRKIYYEKPKSLALEFIEKNNIKGAGGLTPLGEAFLNFGKYGGILSGIYLFLLYYILVNISKYRILIYILFLSQIFNFNRGEFGTTIIEIFIILMGFILSEYICKITIRRQKNGRDFINSSNN